MAVMAWAEFTGPYFTYSLVSGCRDGINVSGKTV
jgi:hypothetical protein